MRWECTGTVCIGDFINRCSEGHLQTHTRKEKKENRPFSFQSLSEAADVRMLWAIYESLLSRLFFFVCLIDEHAAATKLMPHANIEWKEKWFVHDWMKGWIIDSVSTITKKYVYSFNSEPMFLKSPGLSHILKSSQSNLRRTPADIFFYISFSKKQYNCMTKLWWKCVYLMQLGQKAEV